MSRNVTLSGFLSHKAQCSSCAFTHESVGIGEAIKFAGEHAHMVGHAVHVVVCGALEVSKVVSDDAVSGEVGL